MGYRVYLGEMSKDDVKKIKSIKNKIKLIDYLCPKNCMDDEDGPYVPSPYKIAEEIYEMGSHIEFELELIERFGDRILKYPECDEEYYCDYELAEISKEGLKFIIEQYKKYNKQHFVELTNSLTTIGADIESVIRHLTEKSKMWEEEESYRSAVNLVHKNKFMLTNSWTYEYTIFQLVSLYKQFDWDTQSLIVYGW